MIKFVHKKHVHSAPGKFVIYYNGMDIFLGTALMILVVFFIRDYLSHALSRPSSNGGMYTSQVYDDQLHMKSPGLQP